MAKNDYLRELLNEIKLRYHLGEEVFVDSSQPLATSSQLEENSNSRQLGFTLELKIIELKQLNNLLEKVAVKSPKQRAWWLDHHQEFVEQISQLLINYSNLSLLAFKGGNTNTRLSLILAEEIEKAISLMNTTFFDDFVINA
ncbi:hypothetical protein KBB59_02380 [Candidatus Woesebacteria bacterium]|nr:hypothetical protein [Candidatus Woesebacteria bacterium]